MKVAVVGAAGDAVRQPAGVGAAAVSIYLYAMRRINRHASLSSPLAQPGRTLVDLSEIGRLQ